MCSSFFFRHNAADQAGLFEEKIISHAGDEIPDLFFSAVILQVVGADIGHQIDIATQVWG